MRDNCSEMNDAISFDDFEEMNDDDLQDVVMIGDRKPKHCYGKKNIANWIGTGKNTDPMNPQYILSRDEIDALLE